MKPPQRGFVILDVLEHVETHHRIEGTVARRRRSIVQIEAADHDVGIRVEQVMEDLQVLGIEIGGNHSFAT